MTAERCVTARELAGLMGVSLSTVRRMAAAGMLSETWGLARTRWFLPSQRWRGPTRDAVPWTPTTTLVR